MLRRLREYVELCQMLSFGSANSFGSILIKIFMQRQNDKIHEYITSEITIIFADFAVIFPLSEKFGFRYTPRHSPDLNNISPLQSN